jgi:hypothetical protein
MAGNGNAVYQPLAFARQAIVSIGLNMFFSLPLHSTKLWSASVFAPSPASI